MQLKEEKIPACSFKFNHLTRETKDLCIFALYMYCKINVTLTCQNRIVSFRGTRALVTSCTLRTSVKCPTSG